MKMGYSEILENLFGLRPDLPDHIYEVHAGKYAQERIEQIDLTRPISALEKRNELKYAGIFCTD